MLESQRKLLEKFPHKRISLGITDDGEPRRSISIPWDRTANAFNMRTPDIYLAPADLSDPELWARLEPLQIIGCYCFSALEDYSFLSRMPHLQDIRLFRAGALRDLSFLTPMEDWFQLHIEEADLDSLAPLFPNGPRKGIHSYCLCLSGCTVRDHSALLHPDIWLSELVILAPEGSNERSRWSQVRCGKYSYYEYRIVEEPSA